MNRNYDDGVREIKLVDIWYEYSHITYMGQLSTDDARTYSHFPEFYGRNLALRRYPDLEKN